MVRVRAPSDITVCYALAHHYKASFTECPDCLQMVNAWNLGHGYTLTVTERTSSPFRFSCSTSRYS